MNLNFPPEMGKMKLILTCSLIVIFSFLFCFILMQIDRMFIKRFDLFFIHLIQGWISPSMTELMKAITILGSKVTIAAALIVVGFIFIWRKKLIECIYLYAAVLLGRGINTVLKEFVERNRPDINPLIEEHGFSFPSGHSMNAIILFGMLNYLLNQHLNKGFFKIISIIFSIFLILMVGISRVYLGVHYPSDIIAGYLAGGAWLILCIALLTYQQGKSKVNKQSFLGD